MQRTLTLLLVLSAMVLGFVTPAAATVPVYPPRTPTVDVSTSTPKPKEKITLVARDFCPGTEVSFSIGGVFVGTAIADENGVATLPTTAPDKVGSFEVVAEVTAADPDTPAACVLRASSVITIVPIPAAGADTKTPLVAAGLAVAVGGLMVIIAARRRRPNTAH